MTSSASLDGDERLRLFVALRLPEEALDRLCAWQAEAFAGVSRVRPVRRESLHVTVAFLGARPAAEAARIAGVLGPGPRPALRARRYRETRSVGMLVLDDPGGVAAGLAAGVHERLERLGVYRRERRPWLPHVTVVRFREAPRLRLEAPGLGELCPSDVALYHSVLRSGGAQYEVLHTVALGG